MLPLLASSSARPAAALRDERSKCSAARSLECHESRVARNNRLVEALAIVTVNPCMESFDWMVAEHSEKLLNTYIGSNSTI